MAKKMKLVAALSTIAAICFFVLFSYTDATVFKSLAITFGTIAYHFGIRLVIGTLFSLIGKNRADYTRKWYHVRAWEQKLYAKLKVKKWKNKMPTYDMNAFDISRHSWDEIAQASCQAELVHESNIVFSFVPVIFSVWFGAAAVFVITSALGAAYDLMFVIMQRFNRPRILKMVYKSAKKHAVSKESDI